MYILKKKNFYKSKLKDRYLSEVFFMENIKSAVTFTELLWDTEFFGVKSAKAILKKPLKKIEWENLKKRFEDYQFLSILNLESESFNAQLIGKDTSAFLIDTNIQFVKKLTKLSELSANVTIHQALAKNEKIIEIADFSFSKFTEDPELLKRRGNEVYSQWLLNAFEKKEKFFLISKNIAGEINGFVLFSYLDSTCIIELIAVSTKESKGGIGTSLFNALEHISFKQGIKEIKVGTQIKNLNAINFYHKMGCKQVGCHQVFHLWNL